MMVRVDLTGKKFGRITVRAYAGQNRWRQSLWRYTCSCDPAKTLTLSGNRLLTGSTESCGCLRRERKLPALPATSIC